ncbi:hypothetical protein D7D52_23925 [Nocardia yunnanensis]|uniref:Uncharacterized protein n=1 Tax=Nocardia yunnanensis TaxID=2382165 RepID=A0A386ZFY0_9NOCA|nr:hypothetical protein [Nocardia yunnanensis]AYF76370.1 hypothetical protein D7D52_23925 [Nocardia yunnanensis]
MRTFVHLLLFAAAVVVAVGVFGPLVGTVDARNVQFSELRDGFASGRTLDQIGAHSGAFTTSLAIGLLGVAAVLLLAALVGSRILGWIAVIVGLVGLGVLTWRLDDRFDHELRSDYRHLLDGAWGLWLVGGGLVVALILLLVPRERRLPPPPPAGPRF